MYFNLVSRVERYLRLSIVSPSSNVFLIPFFFLRIGLGKVKIFKNLKDNKKVFHLKLLKKNSKQFQFIFIVKYNFNF